MASAGTRAYNRVWGQLQWGPGAEPLVRGQGVKPPEPERLLAFEYPVEAPKLPYSLEALRV